MPYDGFTSYEGNAYLWEVFFDGGTDFVHAPSESMALQRFMAKFPNRRIRKIVRK